MKDLFKLTNIVTKTKANVESYHVKKFNEISGKCVLTQVYDLNELILIKSMNDVKSRLEKLVSRCRHLVGSFKHSEELRRELSKTQAHLLYTTRIQLVQDIAIRWNSTYDMLYSICVNQGALTMLNMDPKYNSKMNYMFLYR